MELQIGNPRPLEFRVHCPVGGMPEERALQKRFRNHRALGEWFRLTPTLLRLWDKATVVERSRVLGRPRVQLRDAMTWLTRLLADGPVSATDVRNQGRRLKYSDKTIWRASNELNVDRTQWIDGKRMWALPPQIP
jgi:hypothetical protein